MRLPCSLTTAVVYLLAASAATTRCVSSFVVAAPPLLLTRTAGTTVTSTSAVVTNALRTAIEETDAIEALTPIQIKSVRKKLSRRRAFNKLATVYLEDDEGPVFSGTRLKEIAQQLQEHELVQVREISPNQVRNIKSVTERLALEVGMEANVCIFVVEIKGHAATLYCPTTSATEKQQPNIQLRTTGKANHWEKRAKALRDNRGQIIR